MKVLLVEDEEFIRDLFKRQLDLSGFTTDAFGNGQDGLAAIAKNGYDLILLDIMLPDINGLQILQNIRSNPANKGVAVILLTNLGQDAVIKQGFELGADGYLVKAAYTPDQIVQEVKNIMSRKQAQKHAAPVAGVAPAPVPESAAPALNPGQATPPQTPPDSTNATYPTGTDMTAAPQAPVTDSQQPASPPAMPTFPGQAQPTSPDPVLAASQTPSAPSSNPTPDTTSVPAAAAPLDPMATSAVSPANTMPTFGSPTPSTSDPAATSTPPSASEIASTAAATDQAPAAAPVTETPNSSS